MFFHRCFTPFSVQEGGIMTRNSMQHRSEGREKNQRHDYGNSPDTRDASWQGSCSWTLQCALFSLQHRRRLQQTSTQPQPRQHCSIYDTRRRNAAHALHDPVDTKAFLHDGMTEEQGRTIVPIHTSTCTHLEYSYVQHQGAVEEHTWVYSPAAQQAAEAMISVCGQKS